MSKSKHRRRWTLESRKPAPFLFPTDRELVWVCVGTDRSTGDSLGPFVGTMLTEAGVPNVYGTIDHPAHALNLAETLKRIEKAHPNACIIGIDASLGRAKSVGLMELKDGALEPGIGIGKVLPSFGDYNIIGIVNVGGFMEREVLQSTRLSLVIQMAKSITDFILRSLEARAIEQVAATGVQGGKHMGDKVYIAGPMSGYEEFNFPAFNRVEELLRESYGYKHVVNPAKLHPTTDLPWVKFLKQDLQELIDCDAVFLLEGWEKSQGATLEAFVACVLGLRLYKMNHNERFELYEPGEFLADLDLDLLVRGVIMLLVS